MTIEELQVEFETAIAEDPSRELWDLAQWKAYFAEPVEVPTALTAHEVLPWLVEDNRLFALEDAAANRAHPAAAVCAIVLRKLNDPNMLLDLHDPVLTVLLDKLVASQVISGKSREELLALGQRATSLITTRFGVDSLHDGDGMEVLRRLGLLPVETLVALGHLRSTTTLEMLADQS